MYVCATQVCVAGEGVGSLETGVAGNCKLPCGCWDANLCPLKKQEELLAGVPSLQP